jgi:hypothetical protein
MKQLLNKLLSYRRTKLPVGLTEFHAWADSIIDLSGKFADTDSMKWAIASQVQHLDHKVDSIPKDYFVRTLRKAAANQIAAQVFTDIKEKQAKKLAEDTAAKEAESKASEETKN